MYQNRYYKSEQIYRVSWRIVQNMTATSYVPACQNWKLWMRWNKKSWNVKLTMHIGGALQEHKYKKTTRHFRTRAFQRGQVLRHDVQVFQHISKQKKKKNICTAAKSSRDSEAVDGTIVKEKKLAKLGPCETWQQPCLNVAKSFSTSSPHGRRQSNQTLYPPMPPSARKKPRTGRELACTWTPRESCFGHVTPALGEGADERPTATA